MSLKKGLLAVEYALLIAAFIAAVVGAAVYMKRAVCGHWRTQADTFGYGRQYEPDP